MSGSAWEELQGLPAWQVLTVPRRPRAKQRVPGADEGDLLTAQRLAALTSAYHAGGPIAFAWVRELEGGSVRVLAAGRALAAGSDGAQVVLTLPAGGRGDAIGGKAAAHSLAQLPFWVTIGGVCTAAG